MLTTLSEFALKYIAFASGLTATVYGFGERYCGSPASPVQCQLGAITASGEIFDPNLPSLAVPMPDRYILASSYLRVRVKNRPCVTVKVNDKKNPRYIGTQGFDLSPAAVTLLTGKPATRYWSDKVYLCGASHYEAFRYSGTSRVFTY